MPGAPTFTNTWNVQRSPHDRALLELEDGKKEEIKMGSRNAFQAKERDTTENFLNSDGLITF